MSRLRHRFAEHDHITTAELNALCERFGLDRAERRLRLQVDESAALFGAGRGGFHFENFNTLPLLVNAVLNLCGLARRERDNCAAYRVERVEHRLASLPREFDGYTVLQFSDIHADGLVDEGEGVIRLLTDLDYDLAVATGDYRFETVGDYHGAMAVMAHLSAEVRAPDGFFGVLGNHDFLEMVPYLERGGMRVLLNEQWVIRRGGAVLTVAGVDDPHFYGAHDLGRALAGSPREGFTLLLAHSPELAVDAAGAGVGLYLCGHTHGGQVCLPGTIPIIANASCSFRLVRGRWEHGAMAGYTSRGTGFSTAAARFFCPPEVTLHTLRSGAAP